MKIVKIIMVSWDRIGWTTQQMFLYEQSASPETVRNEMVQRAANELISGSAKVNIYINNQLVVEFKMIGN